MTDEKWWNTDYPQQYYAFPTSVSVGGYPVAGVTNLDLCSSKPEFLDSFNPDQLIALTQAQYLSINVANLVIKDGALTNYVAPTTTNVTAATTITDGSVTATSAVTTT